MFSRLDDMSLDLLFDSARTYNTWQDKPVDDSLLHALYERLKWGPTTANTCPARFVFVRSTEGKQRLKPHLNPGNVDKTMAAPCCVIVAYDTRFYELMPQLFPSRDMRSVFEGKDALIEEVCMRSSSLQGGYLVMAARALGLDCGPMSGFNAETLNREFFPDGRWRANFLCNLGYGSEEGLFPRNPRLEFDQACQLL
ncbi:MAG: malonic semialdehyde reductase [Porticoccaceae bacterium]|nr:malonic semialdehyde reductase [Porticoccaceae bacterium]